MKKKWRHAVYITVYNPEHLSPENKVDPILDQHAKKKFYINLILISNVQTLFINIIKMLEIYFHI